MNKHKRNLQSDFNIFKIFTSNYIVSLHTILKINQTSGTGDSTLLKKLKRKHVLKRGHIFFMLRIHNNFCHYLT